MTKAMKLGRSVRVLLQANFDDEAYGLARSLVECALSLRYITFDRLQLNAQTSKFISQSRRDRDFWLFLSLPRAHSEVERQKLLNYAAKKGYAPDGKSAHSHWSGERNFVLTASKFLHPLDPSDLEVDYRMVERASDYYYPSCYVHCSGPGLETNIDFDHQFVAASKSTLRSIDVGKCANTLIIQYIKQIIVYSFWGMNFQPPSTFTCLQDFVYSEASGVYVHSETIPTN